MTEKGRQEIKLFWFVTGEQTERALFVGDVRPPGNGNHGLIALVDLKGAVRMLQFFKREGEM